MADFGTRRWWRRPGFNFFNLNGKYRASWVEEAAPLSEATNARWAPTQTPAYLGTSLSSRRLLVCFFIFVAGLGILMLKTGYLQLLTGPQYYQLAENNRLRLRPLPAERGIIYDHFQTELVQNVPSFTLALIPQELPRQSAERLALIKRIASISEVPEETIIAVLKKLQTTTPESLILKENLDYEAALKLYLAATDLPGVVLESTTKRAYPYSSSTLSLSPLLGYVGKITAEEYEINRERGYYGADSIGKVGIEKSYEILLRGQNGQKKIEVNALGREQAVLAVEPPKPGKNLILTIDLETQQELERLVRDTAEKIHRRRLAAIALNPKTGAILALVNWPSFNNNEFSGGVNSSTYAGYLVDPDHPLFNRAIAGTYPPGSTIKPVVAAGALQSGVISSATTVSSVGGIQVGRWFFKDWNPNGHGLTNVYRAIAWSINTFFYYIGGGNENFVGLGIDRLLYYFKIFQLGVKTGIDIPGERAGFVPTPAWKREVKGEPWFIGDTYNLSIGEGELLVTPLQVASWTATIANGGTIIQPHLGEAFIEASREQPVFLDFPPKKNGVIAADHLAVVRAGMRDCVSYGSCKLLQTLPFTSGAKTGTAQWNNTKDTHAWFTAFAPFSNPQIVVTVLIEEGGQGGVTAIPVARDFLAWWGKKYLTAN